MADDERARAEAGDGHLAPVHTGLQLLAEETFALPLAPHHLVTFLNRALKRHGFAFGLSQDDTGLRMRVYLTRPRGVPDATDSRATKDGDDIGDRRERDG